MIRPASRNVNVKRHYSYLAISYPDIQCICISCPTVSGVYTEYTQSGVPPKGGTVNHQGHIPSTPLKLYMG